MDFQTLRYGADGGIARIVFARPALLNRMDMLAHEEFEQALARVHRDPALRVLVIGGEGKHFSAGGDLDEVERLRTDAPRRQRMFHDARHLVHLLVTIEIPVIAAVQGEAAGLGATIATLCDVIVVARDSGLCDPHVAIGLAAGDGGVVGWPLAMGLTRAKRHLLLGERIGGEQAVQCGLATDLVDTREQIAARADELAARVAALAPVAVRGTKRALITYTQRAMADAFESGLAAEAATIVTEDVAEAVAAFRAKRKPVFKGA